MVPLESKTQTFTFASRCFLQMTKHSQKVVRLLDDEASFVSFLDFAGQDQFRKNYINCELVASTYTWCHVIFNIGPIFLTVVVQLSSMLLYGHHYRLSSFESLRPRHGRNIMYPDSPGQPTQDSCTLFPTNVLIRHFSVFSKTDHPTKEHLMIEE